MAIQSSTLDLTAYIIYGPIDTLGLSSTDRESLRAMDQSGDVQNEGET